MQNKTDKATVARMRDAITIKDAGPAYIVIYPADIDSLYKVSREKIFNKGGNVPAYRLAQAYANKMAKDLAAQI